MEIINTRFNSFLKKCKGFTSEEIEQIKIAFKLAESALEGLIRENGEPFIFHAIAIAEILVEEINLTATTVTASFLHEASRKQDLDIAQQHCFDKDCMGIVEGLNKISQIDIKTTGLQVENFRKLIVSLSRDPRVILIKLVDRLEVMRSLHFFPKSKQMKKSNETLLLYAPLAHQLGLYKVKSELEDISLKYIEAESYRSIVAKLRTTDKERKEFISRFLKPIEEGLKTAGLKYEIKSRTKSIYSIWRKMKKQNVPFEGVYDVFAIRIIIDTELENEKGDCWRAYSIVTDVYTPNTNRLRDWLSAPKSTGYESLHITVDTKKQETVEVQIRSARMDDIAENGIAAHWKYKGVQQIQGVQNWLEKVKNLLSSGMTDVQSIQDIKHDEIFVFTPSGDLRQLPIGASILDFAFDIHTNIGSHCVGAKVNGRNSTIKEKLKTGDVVEILTSKNQSPKADWLNYVVSTKARARIKQRIREEHAKQSILGKEMLERRFKNWKINLNDDVLSILLKNFKLKVITDLYDAIAVEKISLAEIKEVISKEKVTKYEVKESEVKTKKVKDSVSDILKIDENLDNISFKLAKCCNPIFGDEIFGFVTIKEGIKIHRINCPNAARMLDNYNYRVVKAQWRDSSDQQSFQATLRITGYEEPGLVANIGEVILRETGISMRSFNLTNTKKGFEARMQVFLSSKNQLDKLIYHLQKIKGVEKVARLL